MTSPPMPTASQARHTLLRVDLRPRRGECARPSPTW